MRTYSNVRQIASLLPLTSTEATLHLVLRLRGGMLHLSSGRDGMGQPLCDGKDTHAYGVHGPVASGYAGGGGEHAEGLAGCPRNEVLSLRKAGSDDKLLQAEARLDEAVAQQHRDEGDCEDDAAPKDEFLALQDKVKEQSLRICHLERVAAALMARLDALEKKSAQAPAASSAAVLRKAPAASPSCRAARGAPPLPATASAPPPPAAGSKCPLQAASTSTTAAVSSSAAASSSAGLLAANAEPCDAAGDGPPAPPR